MPTAEQPERGTKFKEVSEFCTVRLCDAPPFIYPRGRGTCKCSSFVFRFGGTEPHNRSASPFQREREAAIRLLLLLLLLLLLWGLWFRGGRGCHLVSGQEVGEGGRSWPGRREDGQRAIRFRGTGGAVYEGAGKYHGSRPHSVRADVPIVVSSSHSTSSSSGAKRYFMVESTVLIGIRRPPNSSPGSPWYMRPWASLKWYLRVFES